MPDVGLARSDVAGFSVCSPELSEKGMPPLLIDGNKLSKKLGVREAWVPEETVVGTCVSISVATLLGKRLSKRLGVREASMVVDSLPPVGRERVEGGRGVSSSIVVGVASGSSLI
jgi:hypothetical protein